MTRINLPIVTPGRSCDGCTKCCEGWLSGEVYGERMFPGRPCRYKAADGCSIYEQRPADPCKVYSCMWVKSDELPLWMKPNEIDAIFSEQMTPYGEPYWLVTEAGSRLDSRVLAWIIEQYVRKNHALNVMYQVSGVSYYLGTPTFLKWAVSLQAQQG